MWHCYMLMNAMYLGFWYSRTKVSQRLKGAVEIADLTEDQERKEKKMRKMVLKQEDVKRPRHKLMERLK